MNQSLKVFFSCTIGSFVGTPVAFQVNRHFWWLGLMVGFLAGYLVYEYKEVAVSIQVAWQDATNWEPDKAWWKAYGRVIWKTWVSGTGILSGPTVVAINYAWFTRQQVTSKLIETGVSLAAWLFVPAILICMVAVMCADETLDALEQNPFATIGSFYKTWFWDLPRLPYKALTLLPAGVRRLGWAFTIIGNFVRCLFKLIHSEMRLLCGVDAAIGAAIGYHYHGAIIGAIFGGMWGVFNFEVFSVRVLKCVPGNRSLFH